MFSIQSKILSLKLKNSFRLGNNASSDERHNILVRIQHDGLEGLGEAALPPYYPETTDSVQKVVQTVAVFLESQKLPTKKEDLFALIAKIKKLVPDSNPSALCALENALLDLFGKQNHQGLWQILGISKPSQKLETSFTIAIDTPEVMAQRALESKLPILKIKVGSKDDLAVVEAIRKKAPNTKLRLDANGAWSRDEALKIIPKLAAFNIELIEQPLAKDDLEGMRLLKKSLYSKQPLLYADESMQGLAKLDEIAAGFGGIVVKTMKTAGPLDAVKLITEARKKGLKIMLSCMIESSLGVTAAAGLAGLADCLDLDAPLLISNDPFQGISYSGAFLEIPFDQPGLGVASRRS